MDEQRCHGCNTVKPISDFHRDSTKPTGHRVKCKTCVKAYGKNRYQENAEAHRAWRKTYYTANRDRVLAKAREYAAENADAIRAKARERRDPEASRWAGIFHRYRITQEQYEALWESQGSVCPICLSPDMSKLHVDHDHSCCPGKKSCGNCIRGIVCSGCNLILGHASDSSQRLMSAVRYLTVYESRTWYRRTVTSATSLSRQ